MHDNAVRILGARKVAPKPPPKEEDPEMSGGLLAEMEALLALAEESTSRGPGTMDMA